MKFKAKVDWWLKIIFAAFLVINIWAVVGLITGTSGDLLLAIIFAPINIYILPIWLNTYYFLNNNELLIKSGLGRGTRLAYSQILSVSQTRNPISSPAPSLDRLEIKYRYKSGNFTDSIIISPRDKIGFTKELLLRNGKIEINNESSPVTKSAKIAIAITTVTLAGICALFIIGLREPVVTISSDSVRISAMYGLTVDFSEISNITLLDESMREIGAGVRTNGFNGGAWRGHFTAGLLFVVPDSSPTIRIERYAASTIFISFRDDGQTPMLYDRLRRYIQPYSNFS